MAYLLKTLLAAAIIVGVTELAKRSSTLAALLLALPLVSVTAFVWMWAEGQGSQKIADVSASTFWYILPTLPMFILLPVFLRNGLNFLLALVICIAVTTGLFYLTQYLLSKFPV